MPKAVDAWRTELTSKGRKKLAEAVASPDTNSELFTEGWEEALGKENAAQAQHGTVSFNGANSTLISVSYP